LYHHCRAAGCHGQWQGKELQKGFSVHLSVSE
jgi:hypothetical protein